MFDCFQNYVQWLKDDFYSLCSQPKGSLFAQIVNLMTIMYKTHQPLMAKNLMETYYAYNPNPLNVVI